MNSYNFKSYMLPTGILNDSMHVVIYFNKMRIEWVLEAFSLQEINELAQKLKYDKNLFFDKSTKSFVCKNKFGKNKIEKLLMKHYNNSINNLPVNLIQSSLCNFVSCNNEWQDII